MQANMHRYRHATAHRDKAEPRIPIPATHTSQRPSSRPFRKPPRPLRLAVLCTLLLATTLLLLFARTPDSALTATPATLPSGVLHPITSRFHAGPSVAVRSAVPRLLSYTTTNFTLSAVPVRLLSASVHYFRAPPSSWPALLRHARAVGFNAIETYVPWNLHEQTAGHFRFAGMLDLPAFLELAQEQGLLVLLRPGPYICTEWDLGGLPPYLLAGDDMRLRTMHPDFMGAVETWFDAVAAQIAPYIGKPVVAVQIENEYGAYGQDERYMHSLVSAWEHRGLTRDRVMFFTSDNGGEKTVLAGSPFDSTNVLKTINLEWQAAVKVAMLRSVQPEAPVLIAEFWTGWFDHWGEKHHVRDGVNVVTHVRGALLDLDASVNLYMFFGGTTFGFMAGANVDDNGTYLADVTSYDYDAFITEHGAVRKEKYLPMQTMIRRFWKALGEDDMYQATLVDPPKDPKLSAYAGLVALRESISMYDGLDVVSDTTVHSEMLVSMEKLGGDYGFVMYRHNLTDRIPGSETERIVEISRVRDFAYILADGLVVKTIDRNHEHEKDGTLKKIRLPAHANKLDIIVENRGRINYGPHIHDRKGILGEIKIDNVVVHGFECRTMSFPQNHPLLPDVHGRQTITSLHKLMTGRKDHPPLQDASSPPTFFRGEMTINPGALAAFGGELPGTYCRVFGRGVLWVNGFNVGRFHTGVPSPQRSLFVPGALLREGRNEFMVLHMNMYLAREPAKVQLFEQPDLGPVK